MRLRQLIVVGSVALLPAHGAAQPRTTADGVYSLAQARRGAQHMPRCVPCHGDELEGDLAPPLVGEGHLARWAGRPLSELFARVVTNFDGLAQQGSADEADPIAQRAADFIAYLLLQNGFKAGDAALGPTPLAMQDIVIVPPPKR